MQIAMLDLMPLLWGLCIVLSAALALYGDHAAPARTVPAAVFALLLHFMEKPPRLQVIVFFALYALCAGAYAVLCRYSARHRKSRCPAPTSSNEA